MKKINSYYHSHSNKFRLDRIITVTAALLVIIFPITSLWAATPSSSAIDAPGYEIPLGELNKVKKEHSGKKETKDRKRKKGTSKTQQTPAEVIIPPEKVDQGPAAPANAASSEVLSDGRQSTSGISSRIAPDKPEPLQIDPVTIHHDPYSYVITGKRTLIQAVISSTDNIKAVYCRFQSMENGANAIIPMLQTSGTQFTYAAVLPSLAAASRSLRYNIIVINSLDKEARSKEFVIAVKPSAVLPGWQLKSSSDMIKIRLENKDKPLEGFSDSGIVVE